MKCCSVFADVISRVSLCSWFCMYFVDFVFVLCSLQILSWCCMYFVDCFCTVFITDTLLVLYVFY